MDAQGIMYTQPGWGRHVVFATWTSDTRRELMVLFGSLIDGTKDLRYSGPEFDGTFESLTRVTTRMKEFYNTPLGDRDAAAKV